MRKGLVFTHWWQAMAAVPADMEERDNWARSRSRHSRYRRLSRAWGDPTDGNPPPFYRVEKEKHLVPALWENLTLFGPKTVVRELYSAVGFACDEDALDLCWSYEFNLGHQDRQLDLVLHVRFADHDEIVISEAKAPGKKFDAKDVEPRDVLQRECFKLARPRRYFLLGDGVVPGDWSQRLHGVLRWQALLDLQLQLCTSIAAPGECIQLLQDVIVAQFGGHGIGSGDLTAAGVESMAIRFKALAGSIPAHCRSFIAGGLSHLLALAGASSGPPPFPYLASEPSASQIRPGWREGYGRRVVNEAEYWRLPPRSH